MDMRNRLVGETGFTGANGSTVVDIGGFIRRLLLFDTYILQSDSLKEMPALVRAFGVEGLLQLLESRSVQIRVEPIAIGQTGQLRDMRVTFGKDVLPLGSYSFGTVTIAGSKESLLNSRVDDLSRSLKADLKADELDRVSAAVRAAIIAPPSGLRTQPRAQLADDLAGNVPAVQASVGAYLQDELGVSDVDRLQFRVHQIDEDDFATESNLQTEFRLTPDEAHRAGERGLIALARVNVRLAEMSQFEALSVFRERDVSIFAAKVNHLGNLAQQFTSHQREAQFDRVIELAGFPDVRDMAANYRIDADAILDLRESDEVRLFRDWLGGSDAVSDAEINEALNSLRAKAARILQSRAVKPVRFAVSAGIGLIPGTKFLELGLQAVDTFVVDRLLPKPGPVSFVSRLYPSIFEDKRGS